MVAPSAHQIGRTTSAKMPRMVKTAQKIFFSTLLFYAGLSFVDETDGHASWECPSRHNRLRKNSPCHRCDPRAKARIDYEAFTRRRSSALPRHETRFRFFRKLRGPAATAAAS